MKGPEFDLPRRLRSQGQKKGKEREKEEDSESTEASRNLGKFYGKKSSYSKNTWDT